MLDTLLHLAAIATGLFIVVRAMISAIRTLVLARSARDGIAAIVFVGWRKVFNWRVRRADTFEQGDRIMAMYAPVSLISLPVMWLTLITIGYAVVFWGLGMASAYEVFTLSGSSLLTLGFERHDGWTFMIVQFSEATIGLIMIALLLSYLPTMYGAFSRREAAVTMLEIRAGSPPSAVELLSRASRIQGLEKLTELWEDWELWFSELEESHTSLAALVFFRSPKPDRSWVTASGTILDAAAITASTIDQTRDPMAELCVRAGYIALRSIADFFNMPYDPDPAPDDTISVSRAEYDAAYDMLLAAGLPLKRDRDQAWRDYVGWRVNYDTVLLDLAALTMAPYAPWISDRSRLRAR